MQNTKLGTITVLMPAKNAARTVLRAANTTLRALPRDGKLLVLDDASTDSTRELVKGIRDPRVHVLSTDQPLGVARGLNELLNSADSEFVARMDADDVTLPSRFATQSRSLSRGLDVTFGGVVHFGESLSLAYPSPPCPLRPKAFNVALLVGNPVAHSTMLARRSALVQAGGYATGLAEDYELWMRMASQGYALSRSALPVVALRRHPGQVTARDSWSERAQLETFWQASYRELARVVLGEGEVARHSGPLDRANAPVDKARVLSNPLLEIYKTLNGVDRLGVQLLARRSGFILREGRS
ncbi:glycosyltransferase [Frigoribacterium sp. CFBP 13707]|nr:glycosyltransferase [Frigoribacterium sp. CFBP 13707]